MLNCLGGCTGTCSSSASSTRSRRPFGVRAARPATMTGCSAATSRFARSATADMSPAGAEVGDSFGTRSDRRSSSAIGSSWSTASAIEHDRAVRRRHRDLVGAHAGLREVSERHGHVVPLDVIAHHRGGVLHAVGPLDVTPAPAHVEDVAEDDVDGHAVGVGVVDRHRRVLEAHGSVRHHQHRLAGDLGVAVRHGDRRFLVTAGQELGRRVAAVVDQRFVEARGTTIRDWRRRTRSRAT